LAGRLSTGAATVHKIEAGKNWVSAAKLEKLATALNVPIYALFEGSPEGMVVTESRRDGDSPMNSDTPASRGEVTNELLFETLKAMQATLARHSEDFREIKGRLGILEAQVAGLHANYASLSNRIDRIDERLARVERRLDLIEA
jgi:transcriptional regulator with XRE-family HTH domain